MRKPSFSYPPKRVGLLLEPLPVSLFHLDPKRRVAVEQIRQICLRRWRIGVGGALVAEELGRCAAAVAGGGVEAERDLLGGLVVDRPQRRDDGRGAGEQEGGGHSAAQRSSLEPTSQAFGCGALAFKAQARDPVTGRKQTKTGGHPGLKATATQDTLREEGCQDPESPQRRQATGCSPDAGGSARPSVRRGRRTPAPSWSGTYVWLISILLSTTPPSGPAALSTISALASPKISALGSSVVGLW